MSKLTNISRLFSRIFNKNFPVEFSQISAPMSNYSITGKFQNQFGNEENEWKWKLENVFEIWGSTYDTSTPASSAYNQKVFNQANLFWNLIHKFRLKTSAGLLIGLSQQTPVIVNLRVVAQKKREILRPWKLCWLFQTLLEKMRWKMK